MADLVNPTHKSALSTRNAEPTHLGGASYDVLGGPGIASTPGGDDYKIDAAKGVGTDTTIPRAVGPEASHLKKEEDDPEVEFDGDKELSEVDDLDTDLDALEEIEPIDVDLETEEDEPEDEEEPIAEEDETPEDEKQPVEEEDETPFAKKDDEEPVKEEDENPFAKKDDEEPVKEEDETPEDEDEIKQESLKIRVKLPRLANLSESAGIPAKAQKQVGVLFESALRRTTKQVAKQLQEHYKKLHEQKLAKYNKAVTKQLDAYLSYVTEEWFKANRVAVRQSLRTSLAEEFLNGLHRLFKEHYIDVPESKVDVVKKLTEQNEKLKKSLNEQHAQKLKLRKLAEAANKARIVAEFSRGMSEASSAKLLKLAEDVPYTSAKEFREKLSMLKESYLTESKVRKVKTLPEEAVQTITEEKKPNASGDPTIDAIAKTISQHVKSSKW